MTRCVFLLAVLLFSVQAQEGRRDQAASRLGQKAKPPVILIKNARAAFLKHFMTCEFCKGKGKVMSYGGTPEAGLSFQPPNLGKKKHLETCHQCHGFGKHIAPRIAQIKPYRSGEKPGNIDNFFEERATNATRALSDFAVYADLLEENLRSLPKSVSKTVEGDFERPSKLAATLTKGLEDRMRAVAASPTAGALVAFVGRLSQLGFEQGGRTAIVSFGGRTWRTPVPPTTNWKTGGGVLLIGRISDPVDAVQIDVSCLRSTPQYYALGNAPDFDP